MAKGQSVEAVRYIVSDHMVLLDLFGRIFQIEQAF